jgi:hypothetical protein
MVMFHADIPYLVAQQRGEIQKALLEEFTQDASSLAEVDLQKASAAVISRLQEITAVRSAPTG